VQLFVRCEALVGALLTMRGSMSAVDLRIDALAPVCRRLDDARIDECSRWDVLIDALAPWLSEALVLQSMRGSMRLV
jgi:hypothetical protein